MDVLAAKDQENFVHGLQTAAASKPLNAGLKGFAARTPATKAPKTPFKIPLNDENAPANAGKSALHLKAKGNDKAFVKGNKEANLDSNAFVTPAGTLEPQGPLAS